MAVRLARQDLHRQKQQEEQETVKCKVNRLEKYSAKKKASTPHSLLARSRSKKKDSVCKTWICCNMADNKTRMSYLAMDINTRILVLRIIAIIDISESETCMPKYSFYFNTKYFAGTL